MLKRTITFRDIDDNEVTEEFRFNVTRSDMIDLLVEKPELEEKLQAMGQKMDGRAVMGLLREFIILGVGRRPEGSRQFVKSKEILNDFLFSGAYDALYWELTNDPDQADAFLTGLFPTSLLEEIQKTGQIADVQRQLAEGKTLGEITVDLPKEDWSSKDAPATQELPKSGTIDTVEGKAVTGAEPTPFPESLAKATEAQREPEDSRPAWVKENREPTSEELRSMSPSEFALAFRMKNEGKFEKKD